TANLWKNLSSRQGASRSHKSVPKPLMGTRLIFSTVVKRISLPFTDAVRRVILQPDVRKSSGWFACAAAQAAR
ncbi:MAG: hypothetical protein M3Z37_01545, partial [Candidatus Eremiobacteraeota bacterium]|nr:hypothetical protein [Candidatus Eremiobacteraeota bacterium]